ncbi:MAG: PilZ domain-containing protein [Spirochaetales bacterium]|nr:PilZ domain-containing protein [Spirochaetales bacterium]
MAGLTDSTRAARRELCFIRAFVNGHTGQIRDITTEGMKIALFGHPPLSPEEKVNVKIIPDESLNIPSFYVRGTVRWVKKDPLTVNFGLSFTEGANMSVTLPLKQVINIWK